MEEILDRLVTIKAMIEEVEMLIMRHPENPLNAEIKKGQCEQCLYSKSVSFLCQKYNQVPPANVISGELKCGGFELDDIPF